MKWLGKNVLMCLLLAICLMGISLGHCEESYVVPQVFLADGQPDYADSNSWVSMPETTGFEVDTFFLLPTVNMKMIEPGNDDITVERNAARYVKTLEIEKGIVSGCTNIFAPFYREASIGCYLQTNGRVADYIVGQNETFFDIAYNDVRNAWLYYVEHLNEGRPVVLFAYSQGAQILLRLLAEFCETEVLTSRMVAAYAIGMTVTEDYIKENPQIRMAEGETDTGVVISYNAVDAAYEMPKSKEASINPLNWKTDSTPAAKTENLGFTVVNSQGEVTMEIPQYCGAVIDSGSGKLIATDMENRDELMAVDSIFPAGDYHLYDLVFFYRNLQKNVETRVAAFLQQ